MAQACNCSNTYQYKKMCVICGEPWNNLPAGCSYNPDDGDFIASRQQMGDVAVWRIGGDMCIALEDDPVYITKAQAMKFFNLTEIT